jgi:nucleotide-binding universal stress UspA family protein
MLAKPRITEILFATDLSENAIRALGYAMSLAEAYGARITVLHVVEKVPPNAEMLMTAFLGYENIDEFRQKSDKELVKRIKERIEQFCADAADQVTEECRFIFKNVLVEPGKSAERILHHSETGTYDVLVMGNRGLGLLQKAFLGGTSQKVLQDCPIPVFIVPKKLAGSNIS